MMPCYEDLDAYVASMPPYAARVDKIDVAALCLRAGCAKYIEIITDARV